MKETKPVEPRLGQVSILIIMLFVVTIAFMDSSSSVYAQVSVQQAIDYWEQCKGMVGFDICKAMAGIGENLRLMPAGTVQGIDYWEQCKGFLGFDTCKGIAAFGEWTGLINTNYH